MADSSSSGLTCAVIIPVGPGHQALAVEAQNSVLAAYNFDRGPFADVVIIPMPDPEGLHGRSRRRNDGIDHALANGIEWTFFLDADDLMSTDAFASAGGYVQNQDAVFGMISELESGEARLRAHQMGPTTSIGDVLKYDPFLSLQMGHFVRTKAAAAVRFDVEMNAGEDFKYYLELWSKFRCTKIGRPLFVNRRGLHSSGPRGADASSWRESVSRVFEEFCSLHDLKISFACEGKTVHFAMGNPMDLIQKRLMSGRFFEVEELAFLRGIVPAQATIVEVGANVGNHLVYYGLFMQPKKVIAIEPNPAAIRLLTRNIELNQLRCVDVSLLGLGAGETAGQFDLVITDRGNLGSARLAAAQNGTVKVRPLDELVKGKVDFLKIDVEWMEMEVLRGAEKLIRSARPILFVEIMNSNAGVFITWIEAHGYRIAKTFPYVNARNYVAVPDDSGLLGNSGLG